MSVISRYSGKYDCCDSLEIHGYTLEELQRNVKIYVGENPEPLHIEEITDMIPYYPHLISSAVYDNVEKKSIIHLSSESFVDEEEREVLEWILKYLLKIYNRCKRKKIEFDVEEAVKRISCDNLNKESYKELAKRVKEKGTKATIDNIHLESYEYYRKLLVDEMIKNGLSPIEYGDYQRFIKTKIKT